MLLTIAFKRNEFFRSRCKGIIATKKDITKTTLIVLVQVKKLIAVVQLKKSGEELNIGVNSTSPHQHKKAWSPFYHKKYFW